MKKLIIMSVFSLFIFSCDEDSNPMSPVDECGVVNGDNSTCTDECGVVNGSGLDCNGDCNENVQIGGWCYNIEKTTSIYLGSSGLTGEIPPEIGNLTNLLWLDLSFNQLTGQIPPEIGNLTNLIRLYLYSNQLTGEIPVEIGNLTNLTWLGLYNNQLIGEIPPEIGNLTNLTYLRLDDNQLTGEIPVEICNQGDSNPYVGNNQLCPPYPECLSEGDIGYQDTSSCP